MVARALLPLAALVAGIAAADAQVIEVGPDGVRTLAGPVLTTHDGTSLIQQRPSARMSATASARLETLSPLIDRAGAVAGLSPRLVEAVAYVESRFHADAVSSAGAAGVMQLMPDTARELGVARDDPADNIRGGALYLGRMLEMFDGDLELALAAYNAGPGAVARHGGAPPFAETRAYVAAVMDYLAQSSLPETQE